jgi:hypothetical protein
MRRCVEVAALIIVELLVDARKQGNPILLWRQHRCSESDDSGRIVGDLENKPGVLGSCHGCSPRALSCIVLQGYMGLPGLYRSTRYLSRWRTSARTMKGVPTRAGKNQHVEVPWGFWAGRRLLLPWDYFRLGRHPKAIRSLANRSELQRQLTLLHEGAGYRLARHR